jgi:hypothetical protein
MVEMGKTVVSYREVMVREIIMRMIAKSSHKSTELQERILCHKCFQKGLKGGMKAKTNKIQSFNIL